MKTIPIERHEMKRVNLLAWVLMMLLPVAAVEASPKWKLKGEFGIGYAYDTNVFNLSPRQVSLFEGRGPAEESSGRFRDMNSISDHVLTPGLSLKATGPGLFGRDLELNLSFVYEAPLQNPKRSTMEIALALRQSLWKRGTMRITGSFIPEMFIRNYLLDAVAEANGQVLPENRIYTPGICREARARLEYEHRILKKKQTGAFGLTLLIGSRFSDRQFRQDFPGRDRRTMDLLSELSVDLKGGWELGFGYRHRNAKSPVTQEVLVVDEPVFGVDLNGNGSTSDLDIRIVGPVNRSFRADYLQGWLKAELSKRAGLRFRAVRRLKNHLSLELYDGYLGRQDKRWVFEIDYRQAITGGLVFRAGYAYNTQKSSLADVTGDEDDYSKHNALAALLFRF